MIRRKTGLFVLSLVAVLAVVAVGSYQYLLHWADRPIAHPVDPAPYVTTFAPGASLVALANELHQNQLLDSPRRWLVLGRLTGMDTQLQAGEYRFESSQTPRQWLEAMYRGDTVNYEFRIEEGATVAMTLARLALAEPLEHTLRAHDAESLLAELPLSAPFAEGMFLPETYYYQRGDLDREILQRAHGAMQATLKSVWASRASNIELKNSSEVVILASIIEKETGLADDRNLISQVFHNRLRKRMRLQSDPTVIYALGSRFDGNLTRADLHFDSPFNTYRYRQLPPTPIALPSVASLRAAVQPSAGEFLYFVARGDGSSQFSKTLAEHNAAVRKYQLSN